MDVEITSLTFKPTLFQGQNTKKLVATQELLAELKKITKELSLIDQETVDTRSLAPVAKQLISNKITEHQNQSVQSYAACCLVDILRLFAPEAPYDNAELDRIFVLFISRLKHLKSVTDPLYSKSAYLLDSLASIRSVALSTELEDSEKIMVSFFSTFFEIINPDIPRKVQIQMTEVLQHLIEENDDVPQQVLDIILVQFLKKNQTENPAAHQMAIDLCNNTTTILQKYVCQYFNDIIIASSKQTESDKETITNLKTAHYLILELNKTASGILQNVVPQLEEELSVDESSIRSMATQVLGEMFLDKGYTLASRFPSTWNAWVRRRSDKYNAVRVMWVEHAVLMLQKQPQLAKELNEPIIEKLEDIDEKVRKTACFSFTKLEITPIVQNSLSEKMLEVLGERCKDRKLGPRIEATQALSHIYDQVYDDISSGNKVTISKLGEIPSMILSLIYVGLPDIICNAEAALFGGIFGTSSIKDDRARTLRLVNVYNSLNQKAKVAFSALVKRQSDLIFEVELLIKYALKYSNADSTDNEKINKIYYEIIKRISASFPEQEKFSSSIYKLIQLKNVSVYEEILKTIDPQSDFKKVRKEQREVMRTVRDVDPDLLEPLALLLKSISLTTINKSIVVPLLELASGSYEKNINQDIVSQSNSQSSSRLSQSINGYSLVNSQADKTSLNKGAMDILKVVVKFQPVIFSSHVEILFDIDSVEWDSSLESDDEKTVALVDRLSTMSMFAKLYPDLVPSTSEYFTKISGLVTNGKNPRVAKYAASILAKTNHYFSDVMELVNSIIEDLLLSDDPESSYCLLAALSRFAILNHKTVDTDKCDQLFFALQSFLNGEVQMFGLVSDTLDLKSMEEVEFKSRELLSDNIKCQIYALKFLINRVCGSGENSSMYEDRLMASPGSLGRLRDISTETKFHYNNLVSMLRKFVNYTQTSEEAGNVESKLHLKLVAGSGLLKLSRQQRFEKLMTLGDLESLRLLVQDPNYDIRYIFVAEKLIGALSGMRISSKYIPLLFLVAHDPEQEIKTLVKGFVQNKLIPMYDDGVITGEGKVVEESLVMLLYILSRHPDFLTEDVVFSCNLFSTYINYFINIVANSENVSLLYSLTTQLKTVRDSSTDLYLPQVAPISGVKLNASLTSPTKTDEPKDGDNKLWILTDLCLYLIQQRCSSSNWSLSTSSSSMYPSILSKNGNIFTKLTSEQQFVVMSTSFLPPEFINPKSTKPTMELGSAVKTAQKVADLASPTKKGTNSNSMASGKRRRNKPEEQEDAEEEEDEEIGSKKKKSKETELKTPTRRFVF
ncbi:Sister chromatid cohesion protein pds5 [Smittium mucronatum]|uniref:Sister chromatid cohesion protein pds5 n=1 Tax=Smittium mucronatum TaxID=133383 RepID=A0A1R0H2K0_9FUNG|nr:Sister chromatid cohesion protein pds5 [Smittium mucronatum]